MADFTKKRKYSMVYDHQAVNDKLIYFTYFSYFYTYQWELDVPNILIFSISFSLSSETF